MSNTETPPDASPAPTVIPPVVGMPLWYWPTPQDRGEHEPKPSTIMQQFAQTQACDARIVYVHTDRLVNLSVTDHVGAVHALADVQLLQEGDELPGYGGYATWPPALLAMAKEAQAQAALALQQPPEPDGEGQVAP